MPCHPFEPLNQNAQRLSIQHQAERGGGELLNSGIPSLITTSFSYLLKPSFLFSPFSPLLYLLIPPTPHLSPRPTPLPQHGPSSPHSELLTLKGLAFDCLLFSAGHASRRIDRRLHDFLPSRPASCLNATKEICQVYGFVFEITYRDVIVCLN